MGIWVYFKWIWFYLKFIWWKMRYHLERIQEWFVHRWRCFRRRFYWFNFENYDAIKRLGENRRLYGILRRIEPEVLV